jgi:arsenite methyltransferase
MLEFDESTAKALEAIYESRDMLRRRSLVVEALGAGAGERVLDVGCGPGFYAADLLERVGPSGAVTGVDASAAMLALAAARAGRAELVEAPATALPFDDGAFDAAISVQVLEYVEDVDRALGELRRVVRPGGRVVLWDVDWATASMHSRDPGRVRRVLDAWDRHLVHPSLPRTLPRRLRDAGFADVDLAGHAFATHELTPEAYGGSLVAVIESYLAGLDDFPRAEREAWAAEQRALGEAGEFYFACVQCCVVGRG